MKEFVTCIESTMADSNQKETFWRTWLKASMNVRQTQMINQILDGSDDRLTKLKWSRATKCSAETAARDIGELVDRGVLIQTEKSGRSQEFRLAQ